MRVDDIVRCRACQKKPDCAPVVEWMNFDRSQKGCEASLTGTASPNLGHDRVGRVQCDPVALQSRQQHASGLFAPIQRDQEPSVENHSL